MKASRQLLVLSTSAISARGLSIVWNLCLIRLLEPSQLGWFVGIQAMVFAGCGFCDLGLGHGYRAVVSRQRTLRGALLGPVLGIQTIAMALYFAGLATYLSWGGRYSLDAALVSLGALAAQWITTADVDLRISGRVWSSTALTVLPVLALGGAMFAAWMSADRLHGLSVGYAVGMASVAVISLVLLGGNACKRERSGFDMRRLARISVPFFFAILVSKIGQFWSLTYVLTELGDDQAGYFGLPVKLYQTFLVLGAVVTGTSLPVFHRMHAEGQHKELVNIVTRLVGVMWLLAGCAAGSCLILSREVVLVAAGERYLPAAGLLSVLALAMLIKTIAVIGGDVLESREMQWVRVLGQSIGTAGQIAAVVYLLPAYGVVAAAAAVLGMDIWLFVWYWGAASRMTSGAKYWWCHARGGFAFAAASTAAIIAFQTALAQVAVFLVLFVVICLSLRVFHVEEFVRILPSKLTQPAVGR